MNKTVRFLLIGTLAAACALMACSKQRFGASLQPIIPASWTTPAWFIDPANSSGTASDNNNCTTNTTACRSYAEIAQHRWGTYSPRIQQATTITWLSSQSGNGDPVYIAPLMENGGYLTLQGNLGSAQQICTGTLSGVVAKNRATPQLLNATLCVAAATGQIVVNTTHPAHAWTYALVSGTTWSISQPCIGATAPNAGNCTEVDTWANGDSYTVYAPTAINLVQINGSSGTNTNLNSDVYIYHLWAKDADSGTNADLSNIVMLGATRLIESRFDPVPIFGADSLGQNIILALNDYFLTGAISSAAGTATDNLTDGPEIEAGIVGTAQSAIGSSTVQINNAATIDWDTIIGGGSNSNPAIGGLAGVVYVDTSTVLEVPTLLALRAANVSGGPAIWGPGTINTVGRGKVSYTGTAANTLKIATMTISSSTTACSVVIGAPATTNCGITLNASNLAAAAGPTGFGGIAFNYGAGSFVAGAP